jgi:probable phosphoglycerate mutase
LAERLSRFTIQAIYTSPLERAVETADAVAKAHNLAPIVREELGELCFGAWEGSSFESLSSDFRWNRFNSRRTMVLPPGGELVIAAQARVVREVNGIVSRHPGAMAAIVSHCDPIRSLISYYLGSSLDFVQRFQVDTASVTIIRFNGDEPTIVCLNNRGELEVDHG